MLLLCSFAVSLTFFPVWLLLCSFHHWNVLYGGTGSGRTCRFKSHKSIDLKQTSSNTSEKLRHSIFQEHVYWTYLHLSSSNLYNLIYSSIFHLLFNNFCNSTYFLHPFSTWIPEHALQAPRHRSSKRGEETRLGDCLIDLLKLPWFAQDLPKKLSCGQSLNQEFIRNDRVETVLMWFSRISWQIFQRSGPD